MIEINKNGDILFFPSPNDKTPFKEAKEDLVSAIFETLKTSSRKRLTLTTDLPGCAMILHSAFEQLAPPGSRVDVSCSSGNKLLTVAASISGPLLEIDPLDYGYKNGGGNLTRTFLNYTIRQNRIPFGGHIVPHKIEKSTANPKESLSATLNHQAKLLGMNRSVKNVAISTITFSPNDQTTTSSLVATR